MDVTRQVIKMCYPATRIQEKNIVSANKGIVETYIVSDTILTLFLVDNKKDYSRVNYTMKSMLKQNIIYI